MPPPSRTPNHPNGLTESYPPRSGLPPSPFRRPVRPGGLFSAPVAPSPRPDPPPRRSSARRSAMTLGSLTWAQSRDGRVVMTWPLGPTNSSSTLASPESDQAFGVDQIVVVLAQESQIVEVGPPAGAPLLEVMAVGEEHVGTTGKHAVAIAAPDLAALGVGGEALGPPLVEGVALGVVEGDDHTGVTEQAPDHLRADEPAPFELAWEGRIWIREHLEGHVGHHQRVARSRAHLVPPQSRAGRPGRRPGAGRGASRRLKRSARPPARGQHAPRRKRRGATGPPPCAGCR